MAQALTEVANGEAKAKVAPAPYLPFLTFKAAIESLEQGVPKNIDRTIWRNQSGVVQTQILMAFRFFCLVDANDRPTDLLHEVVDRKDDRPALFTKLLNEAYRALLDHDITKMTPKMLDDEMERYNVTGETKRKAVTFFLKMAKFGGFPMHPLLSSQVRNTSPRKKRPNKLAMAPGSHIVATPNSTDSGITAKNTREIQLNSGGTVALSLSYDPFALSEDDRKFVFELVDKLRAYAEANPPSEENEEEAEQ